MSTVSNYSKRVRRSLETSRIRSNRLKNSFPMRLVGMHEVVLTAGTQN